MMRLTTIFALALAATAAGGCDDDTTSGGNMDMAASEFPAAPTVGSTQLDRMGRAGVNTALTDPFNTDKTDHEAKQDAYNKAAANNPNQSFPNGGSGSTSTTTSSNGDVIIQGSTTTSGTVGSAVPSAPGGVPCGAGAAPSAPDSSVPSAPYP